MFDLEHVYKDRGHTVATLQAALKTLVQMDQRSDAPNKNEDWRDTVNIPPEFAIFHIRFFNMLEHC